MYTYTVHAYICSLYLNKRQKSALFIMSSYLFFHIFEFNIMKVNIIFGIKITQNGNCVHNLFAQQQDKRLFPLCCYIRLGKQRKLTGVANYGDTLFSCLLNTYASISRFCPFYPFATQLALLAGKVLKVIKEAKVRWRTSFQYFTFSFFYHLEFFFGKFSLGAISQPQWNAVAQQYSISHTIYGARI